MLLNKNNKGFPVNYEYVSTKHEIISVPVSNTRSQFQIDKIYRCCQYKVLQCVDKYCSDWKDYFKCIVTIVEYNIIMDKINNDSQIDPIFQFLNSENDNPLPHIQNPM